MPEAKALGKRGSTPVRETFAATVALVNLSKTNVTFNFPHPAAAERLFTFRILDSAGTKIWESGTDEMSAQVITPATLKKQGRWARTVKIPLKVDGNWLAPGQYSLEAALAGQPAPSASTLFVVTWPSETASTGIKGRTFQIAQVTVDPFPVIDIRPFISLAVPIKAIVTVEEYFEPGRQYVRAPYSWMVETDAEGNYQLTTPPGRYSVSAQKFGANSGDGTSSPSYLVDVIPGQFAVQHIYFPAAPASTARLVPIGGLVTAKRLGPSLSDSSAALVHVTAKGMVNSGGWTAPQLRPRPSSNLAVLEFDFIAEPPNGMATQSFEPIETTLDFICPVAITKIRVHSEIGHSEAVISVAE